MRRALPLIVFLLVWVCCAHDSTRGPQRGAAELERRVDALLDEQCAARGPSGGPGAAVVLTDGGRVTLERCRGLASIEHGIPITPKTRFELASVSKTFTGFAVLLLEKEGKLRLDEDIRSYLPELRDYGVPITVADLLHHTSGISDWPKVRAYAGEPQYGDFGIEALLSLTARQRMLEFEPGTKWSYSNTNYALLAEIVSRVTGRPFGEWMGENVFEPLGMHDTSFPADGTRVLPNRANSYREGPDGEFARSLVEGFEIPGPAHAFSTIEDMAKWIDNLRTGRVGGMEIVLKMQETPPLKTGEQSFYGAGVGMGEYRGVRTVGHSGQTGAFKTELLYCPEVEVGVVVLGNTGSLRADEIARRILDLYLGDKLEPLPDAAGDAAQKTEERPFLELDPVGYERFLGGYRLDADPSVLVAIAREGNWLVGAIAGEGLDFFRPVGPSEFENRHRNCRLTFFDEEGKEGAVARARIILQGNEMWATRVPIPSDASWIDECTGFYYSDEVGAAYEIARESGGLAVHVPNSEGRPLQPVDTDVLAGGIGILTFRRDEKGAVTGFDFGEPEDLGARLIRFTRRGETAAL